MIIYKVPKQEPLYGNYFLYEAPGDEDTPENPLKRNMKVITALPDNRRRTDFTAGADDDIDDTNATPTPAPPDPGDPPTDDDLGQNTDFTTDAPADAADALPDGTETNPTGADTPGQETITPDTADAGDTPDDMGGDTDFTAGTEDTGTEDLTGDPGGGGDTPPADQGTQGQPPGPGVDFDATRKYVLFKEFMNLMNSIGVFTERLESFYLDDPTRNKIIRTGVDKLTEVRDQIYDYIVMRFELNSYTQNLLFYQKMRVSILLIFNLLEKIRLINKANEEEKTKKSRNS